MKKLLILMLAASLLLCAACARGEPPDSKNMEYTISNTVTASQSLGHTEADEGRMDEKPSIIVSASDGSPNTESNAEPVQGEDTSHIQAKPVEKTERQQHIPTEIEQQIFTLVNAERANAGLSEYRHDLRIYELALLRATEAAVNWSHTRPDGRKYGTVFEDFNVYDYSVVSENLGKGFSTAERIVEGLMNSEKHRANILSTEYDIICIAVYTDESGANYLCQLFGKTR